MRPVYRYNEIFDDEVTLIPDYEDELEDGVLQIPVGAYIHTERRLREGAGTWVASLPWYWAVVR